ncbi:hypothetical protein [Anaplasma platys]|uniref:hypothetical protein n=1 Tax=Anaplasma platys TaxID=949 RepID=UPI00145E8AED|nr:hypothetical protein [Anaplasma platys]
MRNILAMTADMLQADRTICVISWILRALTGLLRTEWWLYRALRVRQNFVL